MNRESMRSVLHHQRVYTSSLLAAVQGSALTDSSSSVSSSGGGSGSGSGSGSNSSESHSLVQGHGMNQESDPRSAHSNIPRSVVVDTADNMTPAISSSDMTQIQLTKVISGFYFSASVLFTFVLFLFFLSHLVIVNTSQL